MVFSESKDSRNIMTTVMKNDDMYITPDCTNVKDIYEMIFLILHYSLSKV